MFRHNKKKPLDEPRKEQDDKSGLSGSNSEKEQARATKENKKNKGAKKIQSRELDLSADEESVAMEEPSIRELLEKNLKWSQIIYEQNRKINRKMLWSAIFGWLRLIIILAPIILAVLFLPPILKELWNYYTTLGIGTGDASSSSQGINNLLNGNSILPEQIQKIKELLK
ncbi:MAG: hypothetical protein ABH832_04765 [bacterium]